MNPKGETVYGDTFPFPPNFLSNVDSVGIVTRDERVGLRFLLSRLTQLSPILMPDWDKVYDVESYHMEGVGTMVLVFRKRG